MRWQSSLKAPSRKERCALLYQLGWYKKSSILYFSFNYKICMSLSCTHHCSIERKEIVSGKKIIKEKLKCESFLKFFKISF